MVKSVHKAIVALQRIAGPAPAVMGVTTEFVSESIEFSRIFSMYRFVGRPGDVGACRHAQENARRRQRDPQNPDSTAQN
ncbi:MAG: hypothetical protein O2901_04160 [Verrucomicrobia bacterium]|nr:hypothetical protein [Verrucomicrobiota bacterium]